MRLLGSLSVPQCGVQRASQRPSPASEAVPAHRNSSFCSPSVLLKPAHPCLVGRRPSFLLPEIAQHVAGCTGRSVLSDCGQCFRWAFPPWQSSCPGGPRCASLRPPFFGTTGPQESQLISIFPEGESEISRDIVWTPPRASPFSSRWVVLATGPRVPGPTTQNHTTASRWHGQLAQDCHLASCSITSLLSNFTFCPQ